MLIDMNISNEHIPQHESPSASVSKQEAKLARLKKELDEVPTSPGVYLWKNAQAEVIYVGKAKQLRARMRQYLNFQDSRAKIPLLVEQIESFDYIVVENEHESLVLEKNYIQQYTPYFNADFKDDKSYPFIALTKGDLFPAIKYTREKHRKDTQYFGPYTDTRAARALIDITRRIVPICSHKCAEWRRMTRQIEKQGYENYCAHPESLHTCFDAHVGLGPGACSGHISPEDYEKHVKRVARFLQGSHREFIQELQEDMQAAALDLDFEKAGRIKERIDTIQSLSDKQHAVSTRNLNADVIGLFREETITGVELFMVREGRVINSNEFILNRGQDVPDDELLRMFILRYYEVTESIPHELIVRTSPEDAPVIAGWLSEKLASKHGAQVRFIEPVKGEKFQLLEMAERNAKHALMRYKVRTNYDDTRINTALLELESALALDKPPMRIECFDISTIHGSYTVASMVVFTNGKPDKKQYRRFKIKTPLNEANDFVSMKEVLARRYCSERMSDERFGSRPDLIILDGGKPQLSAAIDQFALLGGLDDIALCGLAKRDEELFVPWSETGPVVLPMGSSSLYLVKQVRDEAHRFAISYHRELRGKGMTASILDDVAGMGPVRKRALLKHFGSFKRIREASLEELISSGVVPHEVACETHRILQQYTADQTESHEPSDSTHL